THVPTFSCSGVMAARQPRNSPACKGKSLRCLRKCRFSYIDTSPALSARRDLTAALRYSARPPQRPSRSHLGCQTHQTYYFAHFQSRPHRGSPVARTRFKTLIYLKRFGAGACGALVSTRATEGCSALQSLLSWCRADRDRTHHPALLNLPRPLVVGAFSVPWQRRTNLFDVLRAHRLRGPAEPRRSR